jgi:hypothetical protein
MGKRPECAIGVVSIMNNISISSISQQHEERDINNITGDLNINQNSPAEDILEVIQAIQHKVGELNIEEKGKGKIRNYLDNVICEHEDIEPNKKSIAESIKQTIEILKEAKTTDKTMKDIGTLIGKTAPWLGTTTVKLGWTL